MADLPYIQQRQEVSITGQDSTGDQVNYVSADANGNMFTKDYSDGPVTPGAAAATSGLIGGQFNSSLPGLTSAQQAALQTDSKGRLLTNNTLPPGTLDVFGSQIVAPRDLQINVQFFNGILSTLISLTTSGGGSGTISGGAAQFSTGTATTAESKGVSVDTTTYASGTEVFCHFTAAFTSPTSANSYQKIGLYNTSNGFYVGYIGTTFFVATRNGGVDTTVAQSSWNMDTLTGAAGSQFTSNGIPVSINFTNLNIFRIRFGWLGAAPIYFEVMSPDGIWVTFHKILYPNSSASPSIQNPNLPVTIDVNKSSADSTNLTITTSCWGAGATFSTDILEDPQTLQPVNIDGRSELRASTAVKVLGACHVGSVLDTNMWTPTLTGSGTNSVSNGIDMLSTGTTANSSAKLNSILRARFISGTVNAFVGGVMLGDTGVANNVKRWGAYDSSDGVYFQLNGTTPGIGVRSGGSDTIVTNFNGPSPFVIDTNFHDYEIQYQYGAALFYQDTNLIHSYVAMTSALSTTPNYKIGFETTNSGGGTTNSSISIRESSIMRYGEENTRPRYFHPTYTTIVQSITAVTTVLSTSLSATIASTTAGNTIIVAACCNAGTLTITDSASQSYLTATTLAGNGTQTSKIFYFSGTAGGVTSVTISSTSSTDLNMVVTEYSGLLTSGALDQTSTHGQTTTSSWTSNSTSTLAQIPELLIGICMGTTHNNTVFTGGTGWSSIGTVLNTKGGANLELFMANQYGTTLTSYAFTGTTNQNDDLYASIATFKFALPNTITSINTPTTIAMGAGTLKKVNLNAIGTGSAAVTFYDNITNSGTIIGSLSLTSAIGYMDYDLDFSTGLTMVLNSTTADFTVVYD